METQLFDTLIFKRNAHLFIALTVKPPSIQWNPLHVQLVYDNWVVISILLVLFVAISLLISRAFITPASFCVRMFARESTRAENDQVLFCKYCSSRPTSWRPRPPLKLATFSCSTLLELKILALQTLMPSTTLVLRVICLLDGITQRVYESIMNVEHD